MNKEVKSAEVKNNIKSGWHRLVIAVVSCLFLAMCLLFIKFKLLNTYHDTENSSAISQIPGSGDTSESQTDKPAAYIVDKYRMITEDMILKYEEYENIINASGKESLATDIDDEYSVDGKKYIKVSDPLFSDKNGIYNYAESIYTKEYVSDLCYCLIETRFSEKNRKLYVSEEQYDNGMSIDHWEDSPAEICDITESSFSAIKKYKTKDRSSRSITFNFIKENGLWKISEVYHDDTDNSDRSKKNGNEQSQDQNYSLDENNLNLNVEKMTAQDKYECSQPYHMPERINECEYYVYGVWDEDNILILVDGPDWNNRQIGIYNYRQDKYNKIVDINSADLIKYYNEDYIIFENNDLVASEAANSPSLLYYDIKEKRTEVIQENINGRFSHEMIYNNAIYYDVTNFYDYCDGKPYVYKYDLTGKELNIVYEGAQIPVAINGSVAAVISDPESYTNYKVQIIEGDGYINCSLHNYILDLYVKDNAMYAYYLNGWIYGGLKDLGSGSEIVSAYPWSQRNLRVSDANNSLIAFEDMDSEQFPCVYDINEDKFCEFDNLPRSRNAVYVKDNYGIIECFSSDNDESIPEQLICFKLRDR